MLALQRSRPVLASLRTSQGAASRVLKAGKRWLYLIHRWLGITTCLLCVMWFLSGLVMLYVPFPSWSDEERVATLPAVDTARVAVLPDTALAQAGSGAFPRMVRLEMLGDEPVYRVQAGGEQLSISATNGEPIVARSVEQISRHLAVVFPGGSHRFDSVVDYDQWTVTSRFDPHRPLYRFEIDDGAGTIVYVSSKTGEIVQNATSRERFWSWLGAVPHWIYFTPIRRDQELWRQAVMWLSGPLVIGAITGLWIGILRLRVRRPYGGARVTPYRGWMKWHHVGGLVGGVVLTTWIASGWLSVNPFKMFARTQLSEEQRIAFAGWSPESRLGVTSDALAAMGRLRPTEISFSWVGNQPLIVARNAAGAAVFDRVTGAPMKIERRALLEAAGLVLPRTRLVSAEYLNEENVYWYSHHRKRPLPVIKAVFDDPSATWLFLDPATGSIAGVSDSSGRTYRWLFNFFHDYDLPVLLRNQPARDIIVWLLSIAGLVISITGTVVGWRALRRSIRSTER